MLILAIESSAKPCSVAVYEQSNDGSGKLLGQYFQHTGFSHSRTLMAMTESLLNNLSLKPADIGLFAVANGPGSFTGVRIGVSAAKGLAFGADKQICGVSTLEAMARQTAHTDLLVCPVMDARRSQVYNALFRWENGSLVRLRDDRAISLGGLAADLKSFGDAVSYMPIGDGADLVLDRFAEISELSAALPAPSIKFQSACGVALAALHAPAMPATRLEPVYLRPSQAERELQK